MVELDGKQPFLSTVVKANFGFDLKESGIDFFQPAYFFKTNYISKDSYFLLLSLESEESFQIMLKRLNPNALITENGSSFWTDFKSSRIVWKSGFCLVYMFDPMVGSKYSAEELVAFFNPDQLKREKDSFNPAEMISFKANIHEENTLPFLPPLVAEVNGSASIQNQKWKLNADVKETEFSSFFKPFSEPGIQSKENCFAYLAIKPKLEVIATLLKGYLETMDFYSSLIPVLEKLNQNEGPIWLFGKGCNIDELEKSFRFASASKSDKESTELAELILELLPKNMLIEDFKPKSDKNWLIFPNRSRSFLELPMDTQKAEQVVFWLNFKQNSAEVKLKISLAKEVGRFKMEGEINNPDKMNWPDPNEILSKLPI